jgi:hypothetical protein
VKQAGSATCGLPDKHGVRPTAKFLSRPNFLEKIMEILQLLLASKVGFAALATVSLAITMLISTLGALAYKANKAGR